ncbi:uncharacterized protein VDAG_07409 [Verticillium dahliae VdLs.17]|uniref:Methyltransferase domain-containing protein n=1 Tax=Verticillium dahliae (strain VdLs.17 / ATCC MYA-4575 / FGSC 10137) TaxID=498257 RepID=G2XAS8_VERDV|nr:uncharacterized protein VDAG_07409 [Verticillium dahliae VdLs.17]EGY16245.1 hypothetical protein VDAG_07409 [Verticillium dahliae VdLs.17]
MSHAEFPVKRRRVDPPSPAESTSPEKQSSPSIAVADPAMMDDRGDTASLTDSARAHSYENGLRYHGYRPGIYAFPNDETEQERDQLAHQLSYEMCGESHFIAPVEQWLERGAEVLDLGTGIGIWCEELADKYPRSSFEGIDLSPIQSSEVPPNVRFYVDDMEHEQGWDFDGRTFDYIHLRHTLHSVHNRPELLKRVLECVSRLVQAKSASLTTASHLKPGGYFEVQEFECNLRCDDNTCPEGNDYALREWFVHLASGLSARGVDLYSITSVADEMRALGFTAVTEHSRKCPVGSWPADESLRFCGGLLRESLLAGLGGLSARPFAALTWERPRLEVFLLRVRESIKTTGYHAYMPFRTVCGRKPLSD